MSRAAELHARALADMAENPLAWEPRLRAYSLDEAFERTVAANGQAYYRYLHSLVRVLLPRTVLELGTCQGGSALFMLLALPEGSTLTTLDLGNRHPEYLDPVREDPRLRVESGDSRDPATYQRLGLKEVDLLFLDTEHTAAQLEREWELCRPLLAEGAVVVLDDIYLNDVPRFWEALEEDKLDTGEALHWSGFGVVNLCPAVLGKGKP